MMRRLGGRNLGAVARGVLTRRCLGFRGRVRIRDGIDNDGIDDPGIGAIEVGHRVGGFGSRHRGKVVGDRSGQPILRAVAATPAATAPATPAGTPLAAVVVLGLCRVLVLGGRAILSLAALVVAAGVTAIYVMDGGSGNVAPAGCELSKEKVAALKPFALG